MSAVSISLILGGLIIFIISFVISYEWSDFPEIAVAIMLILGFIFIISGAILGYKEMNSKKCNNCNFPEINSYWYYLQIIYRIQ